MTKFPLLLKGLLLLTVLSACTNTGLIGPKDWPWGDLDQEFIRIQPQSFDDMEALRCVMVRLCYRYIGVPHETSEDQHDFVLTDREVI
jgi:hypothetical protein